MFLPELPSGDMGPVAHAAPDYRRVAATITDKRGHEWRYQFGEMYAGFGGTVLRHWEGISRQWGHSDD